ncbi:MAG: DnaJ domain-containing protein [Nitrosopumilaceae archaeon]
MNSYQCYQVLGITNDASFKEIKSTYRKLALQVHPDKNMSEKDGKKFKMVTEAYQILRAEHKRAIHSKSHASTNTNSWKYGDNSNKDSAFNSRKKSWWGAKPTDRPPEAEWDKYTSETESAYKDFWKYYEKAFWEYYEKAAGKTTKVDEFEQSEKEEDEIYTNVDPSRCIGCCSCETMAPNVFEVDKSARVNPKSHVKNQRGATSERILDAAQTCPTKAIHVTDINSKRQLFPW